MMMSACLCPFLYAISKSVPPAPPLQFVSEPLRRPWRPTDTTPTSTQALQQRLNRPTTNAATTVDEKTSKRLR